MCKGYLGETQDNFETIQSPIESRESAARSVIATPPSLMSERTFHLSFPSTPLLNEPPTYREVSLIIAIASFYPVEAAWLQKGNTMRKRMTVLEVDRKKFDNF